MEKRIREFAIRLGNTINDESKSGLYELLKDMLEFQDGCSMGKDYEMLLKMLRIINGVLLDAGTIDNRYKASLN